MSYPKRIEIDTMWIPPGMMNYYALKIFGKEEFPPNIDGGWSFDHKIGSNLVYRQVYTNRSLLLTGDTITNLRIHGLLTELKEPSAAEEE